MSLTAVLLGCEAWLEAAMAVPLKRTGEAIWAPVYFSEEQIDMVRNFIRETPSAHPQALMLVGTIKSGKSTLLHQVLPGLIAAEHASPRWQRRRPRPVIFKYSFPPLGFDAEAAAMDASRALANFARDINVPFDAEATPGDALDNLPINLRKFCERIAGAGGRGRCGLRLAARRVRGGAAAPE